VTESIRRHIDLSRSTTDVLFSIIGETGVGKTRLVYESLQGQQLEGLILYTDDESHANQLANLLANSHTSSKVILVADECSSAGREALRRKLNGSKDRVRIVAIESTGTTAKNVAPDHMV